MSREMHVQMKGVHIPDTTGNWGWFDTPDAYAYFKKEGSWYWRDPKMNTTKTVDDLPLKEGPLTDS